MSGLKLGVDCCGDRCECNTTIGCDCGCELFYCIECYHRHCVQEVIPKLKAERDRYKRTLETILDCEDDIFTKP